MIRGFTRLRYSLCVLSKLFIFCWNPGPGIWALSFAMSRGLSIMALAVYGGVAGPKLLPAKLLSNEVQMQRADLEDQRENRTRFLLSGNLAQGRRRSLDGGTGLIRIDITDGRNRLLPRCFLTTKPTFLMDC